jgi:hypothetical protein
MRVCLLCLLIAAQNNYALIRLMDGCCRWSLLHRKFRHVKIEMRTFQIAETTIFAFCNKRQHLPCSGKEVWKLVELIATLGVKIHIGCERIHSSRDFQEEKVIIRSDSPHLTYAPVCSAGSVRSQGSLPRAPPADRFSGPRFERSREPP